VLVDKRQENLIFAFALGEVSEVDFLRAFPWPAAEKTSLGLAVLEFALSHQDADAVEAGIVLGNSFGMDGRYVGMLERLATQDWHKKHEDIVFALSKLASPTSVEAISEAARSRHAYLEEYDDSFELRSKSIHALGKIGTPKAVRELGRLHQIFENSALREKIVRRFQDLASDGASEETREEARSALSCGSGWFAKLPVC